MQRLIGNAAVSNLAGASLLRQPVLAPPPPATTGHPVLRQGSRDPAVPELQTKLNTVGFGGAPLVVDGIFGPLTRAAVVSFQRSHGLAPDGVAGPLTWAALGTLTGSPPVATSGPDQHAGTGRPDAAQQATIRSELNPTVSSGGVVQPWDGSGSSAAAATARAALKTELTAAMNAHLVAKMPQINAVATARRLPMTAFEGPGRQAKRKVDDAFGALASAAVLTTGQAHGRAAFSFTAGVNLLEASDPAVRTPDPHDLANWISETDTACVTAQTAHHFDRARRQAPGVSEEETFLETEVLAPFVAANQADLEKYDRFGFAFAISGPRVLMQGAVVGSSTFPDVPPSPGVPSPAERRRKWAGWEVLSHEYIHTLEHSAFHKAARGRRIMVEGFCEMFNKEVMLTRGAIATAKADSDQSLRAGVEGTDSSGALFPGFDPSFVPDYSSGEYAAYVGHAENIRAALGPGGENAVKAAFFQGHVELIGLRPDGSEAPPVASGDLDLVQVPAAVNSVFALSVMTGAQEADIVAANPGIPVNGPLPGTVHVPGCRHHRVVEASDQHPVTGATVSRTVETRAIIAAQNGVTEDSLVRANPTVRWAALAVGQEILIPVH